MTTLSSSFDLLALEILPVENSQGKFVLYSKILFEPGKTGNKKILDAISTLTKTGNDLNANGKIREFRLRMQTANESFLISPLEEKNPESSTQFVDEKEYSFDEGRSHLFHGLTTREKQLLCFIYRGYRQSHIAFIYGITVATFKSHRKHLYRKMKFHDRADLFNWCENFLADHMEVVRNLAVQ